MTHRILRAVPKPKWSRKQRRRLRSSNPSRRRAALEEDFGELGVFVRKMPCCVAGCPNSPSDPAHARSRGAGYHAWVTIDGVTVGNIAPLCYPHHSEQHRGIKSFELAHKLVVRYELFEAQAASLADAAAIVGRLAEGVL